MQLNLEQLQDYCDAAPIAYYAGHPCPLKAVREGCSCANVVNKSINISLEQINQALKSKDYIDVSDIRALIYHEVSHILLSPADLTQVGWGRRYDKRSELYKIQIDNDIYCADSQWLINVFEDERIENVMRDVYMEVDFYKTCCMINDWSGRRMAKSMTVAFYDMIRLHDFDGLDFKWHRIYDMSRKLIVKYAGLNCNSPQELKDQYVIDIFDLYEEFVLEAIKSPKFMAMLNKRMRNESTGTNLPNGNNQSTVKTDGGANAPESSMNAPMNDPMSSDSSSKADASDSDEPQETEQTQEPDAEQDEQVQDETSNVENEDDEESEEEADGETALSISFGGTGAARKNVEQVRKDFDDIVFNAADENVKQLLLQKFFIKDMHQMQMGAIHKYSGKIDVKAIGRKDWKIFKQPSMFSDGSRIGKKMHLILVLDQSGSYSGNDHATNMILSALTMAEERIRGFEFSVLKFGNSFHVCSKDERYSDSHEGTNFSVEMFEAVNKLKRPGYANFMIMLNDGSAWNSWLDDKKQIIDTMKRVMDHNDCVFILDYSAYAEWFSGVKRAKVIKTYNYVDELSKNVCEALSAMLSV